MVSIHLCPLLTVSGDVVQQKTQRPLPGVIININMTALATRAWCPSICLALPFSRCQEVMMVHNSTHKCQPLQGEERRRDKEWVWTAIHLSSSCLPLRAFPLLSVHNSTTERAWCGCSMPSRLAIPAPVGPSTSLCAQQYNRACMVRLFNAISPSYTCPCGPFHFSLCTTVQQSTQCSVPVVISKSVHGAVVELSPAPACPSTSHGVA